MTTYLFKPRNKKPEPKTAEKGYTLTENPITFQKTLRDLTRDCQSNKEKKPDNTIDLSIWKAAADGDTKSLLELIAKWCGNDVMNWENPRYEKSTPLFAASLANRKDCVTALLSVPNIDVNLNNSQGYTPLHAAVIKNRYEIVKILMKHPIIDPNISSSNDFYTSWVSGSC
jgi:hypothetical protein